MRMRIDRNTFEVRSRNSEGPHPSAFRRRLPSPSPESRRGARAAAARTRRSFRSRHLSFSVLGIHQRDARELSCRRSLKLGPQAGTSSYAHACARICMHCARKRAPSQRMWMEACTYAQRCASADSGLGHAWHDCNWASEAAIESSKPTLDNESARECEALKSEPVRGRGQAQGQKD